MPPVGRGAAGTLGDLVSSVPVVVVIVGVVIAVLAARRDVSGPKPATPDAPVEAAPLGMTDDLGPFEPAFPGAVLLEEEPGPDISVPLQPRRVRSLALLAATVVALGALAGGLLGGTVLLGARFLNRALG